MLGQVLTGVLSASPVRGGGVKGSYTKLSVFLSRARSTAARNNPRPEGRRGFTNNCVQGLLSEEEIEKSPWKDRLGRPWNTRFKAEIEAP